MTEPARGRAERQQDALGRLERDVDAWVATAATSSGAAHLVPLSFLWDGTVLVIATPAASLTSRNLRETGRARIGVGPTRDVVLIDATLDGQQPAGQVDAALADAFAAKTGFDPRELEGYLFLRLRPMRIQAWREENELAGRDLMRGGAWINQ